MQSPRPHNYTSAGHNSTGIPHNPAAATIAALQLIPQHGFEALLWVCASVGLGFTILRLLIRWKSLGHLREDDYAVVVATFLFLALCVTFQISSPWMYAYGGIDGQMRTPNEVGYVMYVWRKYQFATFILFWSTLWTIKASFLLFFRRLLVGTITQRMIWWNLVAVFTAVTYVISIAMLFGSCHHFSDYFSLIACRSVAGADMNAVVLWFSSGADVASDVMIMILPWQLLWGLRVNLRQKIALATIFSMSIVIVVFAVLRVTHTNPASMAFGPITLSLWALLESFVAIIVVCLPTLKSLASSQYGSSSRSNRGYAAFSSSGQGARGQRGVAVHSRGLGSVTSAYSGRLKSDHSDSERPLSPEGIYVTQHFEVTKSNDPSFETVESPRYPDGVVLKELRTRQWGDIVP